MEGSVQGLNLFFLLHFSPKSLSEPFPIWDKALILREASLSGIWQVCQKETTRINVILCLKTMKRSGSVLTHRVLTMCYTSESSWQKPSRASLGRGGVAALRTLQFLSLDTLIKII